MHQSAYDDAAAFVKKYILYRTGLVADVGSYDYNGTLRPLFAGKCNRYEGIDVVAGPNVDIVVPSPYDWSNISDDAYDIIVSTQCLEHVPLPHMWIAEIERICKPGGLIYICAPNTMAYHACPIDCWRVWPVGLDALLRYASLETIECYTNQHGDTTGIARKP